MKSFEIIVSFYVEAETSEAASEIVNDMIQDRADVEHEESRVIDHSDDQRTA